MVKAGQLKVLSSDEIYDIHLATLDVLERVGVLVYEDTALALLHDAGACVDKEKKLVKIPPYILEEALRKAPKALTIFARNPKRTVKFGDGRVYYEPMIGRLNIIDLETRVKRRTTLKDLENLIRLADALENYHILHSGAMMPHIEGVPDQVAHLYGYLAGVKNSDKVVKGTGRGRDRARDCIKMASILAGGEDELRKKPCLFTTCNPISPLQHGRDQTEGLIEYARHRLPVDIASEPQAGATAPVTLAGLLVQQNAEILSALTIAQLANPGAPVFYGTAGTVMDMRVGSITLGAIELGLINVATAQMARYYQLPSRGTAATTSSKILDVQAGYEKATSLLMAALAGINCIFYPGVLEDGISISLEALAIDDEICGMVSRALEGIDTNIETLATEVIEKVGPGGHYLGQKQTLDYLQKEHYLAKLSSRESREIWEAKGSKDLWTESREYVLKILREHQPNPLPTGIEKELVQFIELREKELSVHS